MSSPPAASSIVDCEKRLLQLNAELDARNKSLMLSPRMSTGIRPLPVQQQQPTSGLNNKKRGEIRALDVSQAKTSVVQEQYRNLHFAHKTDSDMLIKSAAAVIRPVMAPGDDSSNRSVKKPAPAMAAPKSKSHYKRNPLDELTRKNLSTEATIRFLKSKISILQQEHDSTRADQTTKGQIIAKQQDDRKRLQASADKLAQQNAGLTEQVDKLEKSLQAARVLLKTKTTELEESTRTIDEQKTEISRLQLQNTNLERRLVKSAEDLEYTRQNVIGAREAEQEISRLHKADKRHAESQLKLLTDQRSGLIAAYKKQLYLLDNLKRQNVCLEQAKLIDFVERDFVRMLDYNKQ